jgi:signal transduction histidine kinase
MKARKDDAFLVYKRARDLLDRQLGPAAPPHEWPALLAGVLRVLWPDARLCTCLLGPRGTPYALDENGTPRDDWAAALAEPLRRWLAAPEPEAAEELPVPPALGLRGSLRPARVPCEGGGVAAVVFPPALSAEEEFWAAEVLGEVCAFAGVRLGLEGGRRREAELRRDLEEQAPFCVLAHMVGPVSHEMQNVFYNIVLQGTLLEREAPAVLRGEIEKVRPLGWQASGMMSRLDEYRHRIPLPRRPLDLTAVVADALDRLPGGAEVVRDLAGGLPRVSGNEAMLRRLLRVLVGNARAVLKAGGGGTVTVRTRAGGGKVHLLVEDDGPAVGGDNPDRVFDPFAEGRAGENTLELAACHGLVKKLDATIRAEDRAPRGLAVVVELAPA